MSKSEVILMVLAILAVAFAMIIITINRKRTGRILAHMDAMLTAAMDGSFHETVFDETMMSAVETRLAHYLSASEVSVKNLADEKDKIKELIADISHQTKTPIANILLYGQLLSEQNLPEESRPCLSALNEQTEKLNFLIDALVKTSRLETGILKLYPKHSSIGPMLHAVLEQIAPGAKEKDITVQYTPTETVAIFDQKWTSEAVYNIVDNAVKYTPAGGSIRVETRTYGLFCRIDITDTGIGIPEEEQAQIFGRFYRSAAVSDTDGVGIGLYLARQIISGEGGYIRVTSVVGKGTTFSIYIPC